MKSKIHSLIDELCEPVPDVEWKYYDDYNGRCITHDEPLLVLIGCMECNRLEQDFEHKIKDIAKMIEECRKV